MSSQNVKFSRSVAGLFAVAVLPILGLIIGLLVVELGYRLFFAKAPESAHWTDRPAHYYLPESSATLQDYPYSKTKPAHTFRIVVIGDSFTFAPQMQFDDAFPKKLERMLNLTSSSMTSDQDSKAALRTEVLNFGVPGFSTHHEVAEVKKALKYDPDLILLQITLNDVQEKPYQPTGLLQVNEFGPYHSRTPLLHYWKSLDFALRRFHNTRTHQRYIDYYFDLFAAQHNWKSFHSSIASISHRSKKKGVPIASVVFPLFGLPLDKNYPFHPLHDKTREVLEKFEIPSVDLFDTFAGIPLERIQLIPGTDFHPNEIGHRMAAEAIYTWLKGQHLVPDALFTEADYSQRVGIYPKISKNPTTEN